MLVEKCVFWNALWGNGLEIGFELNSAEVKNVEFRNSDIIHIEAGAAFSIHNAGTATVTDILYNNIRIEDARQKLFDLAIFRSFYSEDGKVTDVERKQQYLNGAWDGVLTVTKNEKAAHSKYKGKIKNIVFKNISVVEGLFPFSIFYGANKNHLVENIIIKNLQVHGKKIFNLQQAKFYMDNVRSINLQ